MIRIEAWEEQDGTLKRLTVRGHAGAGRYGEDVVCSAVSALVETLALGFSRTQGRCAVEEGRAEFELPEDASFELQVGFDWIGAGLKDLALSHGQFVRWQVIKTPARDEEV